MELDIDFFFLSLYKKLYVKRKSSSVIKSDLAIYNHTRKIAQWDDHMLCMRRHKVLLAWHGPLSIVLSGHSTHLIHKHSSTRKMLSDQT